METKSFLGTGWSFPPTFDRHEQRVRLVSGAEDIQQSLTILLSTRLGERVLHADYGCALDDQVFEPITTSFLTKLKRLVERSITFYEPRIDLNGVDFSRTRETEGLVLIAIDYTIRSTNSRLNYVYPFYLKEGTYIEN